MECCSRCKRESYALEELHPDYGYNKVCPGCLKKLVKRLEANRQKYNDRCHRKDIKITHRFMKQYDNEALLAWIVFAFVFIAIFIVYCARTLQ